jgi:hypothetical protein
MNLRLEVIREGVVSTIKIDGVLSKEGIAEFAATVRACGASPQLNLTDLRSADEEGIQAIRALREAGAKIVGASPYIALRLGTTETAAPNPRAQKET